MSFRKDMEGLDEICGQGQEDLKRVCEGRHENCLGCTLDGQ